MEYSKELPNNFKTWVAFLDMVKRSGFDDGNYTEVVVEEKAEIHITDSVLPKKRPRQFRYKLSLIKDNALEELLSERFNRREFVYWERGVECILREYGHRDESPLILGLRKIKRIILTQIEYEG